MSTDAVQTVSQRADEFIERGFLRIDGAFSRSQAEAAREVLRRDVGYSRDEPATWLEPSVRLGMYPAETFVLCANGPRLTAAIDVLAGRGRWLPCRSVGTFRCAFPSAKEPTDAGTVYLCHPFLVHSAQPHRGTVPRFLVQPPILPAVPLDPFRVEGELSPVEAAIRLGCR
jgi:hypothetical protein